MKTEIICAGFGGQGVLTAGMLLVSAGMEKDMNVLFYPSYGSEMRGGTANCSVKISDKRIPSPVCKQPDVVFSLNTPAVDKFEPKLKSGGLLLVNSSIVPEDRVYREDIRVIKVPANDVAAELNNLRAVNIVMLGALSVCTDLFTPEYLEQAIDGYFAKKGKVNPKNALCFRKGVEIAQAAGGGV
ncbi:2-oxoacid:acceptor oxidoreductase, gamma subunit, pyruvate/2-ketoisovalerate family [Desulfosporosinus orientis DSM 765]|uniref:2-oxoacid:acceptor oxidoreductase, gamma subunit, pyruvate/2-ketoisovalerate family n=1 Tax=Desulfosporosinus orientis (strain ATCC 19365 / DSM 765 / NCIMB 8382 / VKM B-1628 / Singapore I) TaxID=768706 RepID=G7WB05_DESOD|nr:2-oxoacid:acceptor oxidoreductase family protein [Desulfosporosinus orientis]AET67506.1 2-oxoacid:acceptor oxidoreductase, gamma subunit, pyruvate/2-ketoisovalerate family [Desulfosporosinus orientis DSM 765]